MTMDIDHFAIILNHDLASNTKISESSKADCTVSLTKPKSVARVIFSVNFFVLALSLYLDIV